MTKIDKHFNLVLTVEREGDSPLYVYITPLSEAAFESNWLLLSKTYAEMVSQGWAWLLTQGPRRAALMLREVAKAMGPSVVEELDRGLLPEMTRLAMVVAPTGEGYEPISLDEAVKKSRMSVSDVKEVQNALAFFIVCSSTLKMKEASQLMGDIFGMSTEQLTSSSLTEFMSSLPTLSVEGSTGPKAEQSFTLR